MPAVPPPVAVLDANVLYPQFLRDVLLRLAAAEIFHPRWTEQIHEEWTRNVLANRPEIPPERLVRVRQLMERTFPEARVRSYRSLKNRFAGVDPGDRHVAAAALASRAGFIVTRNLRHFPAAALAPFSIRAIDPDPFIARLVSADPVTVRAVLELHREGLRKPALEPDEYRDALLASGLPRTVERLFG